ncbi:hypothetical protein EDB19DRAFT_1894736 [Suillus lakei]|nr:hypothetical protein EDB19DRAFT_1894736 [Suillus lakei]
MELGFKEGVFNWLESIISCELPYDTGPVPEMSTDDAKKPPQLDDQSFEYEFCEFLSHLAIECNWHHVKHGEKRGEANCCMQLDGSVQNITTVDIESGSIELRRWRGRVNNFTDLILFLMQCNTDTQFIGSGEAAKAVVFYITKYITKGDLPMYVGLQALDHATKMHDALKYIKNKHVDHDQKDHNLITKSEVSHQQVMSYLVGGGDFYMSHTLQSVKWYEFVHAADRFDMGSTCYDESDASDHDEDGEQLYKEQVTMNVSLDTIEFSSDMSDYMLRPLDIQEFADLCLWEFIEKTIKVRAGEQ